MHTELALPHRSRRLLMANALLAIALPLCVFISGANAQFRFAAQGGVNFSNLDESGSSSICTVEHLTGFVGGAKVEYQLSEAAFVYLGAQYAQKGDGTKMVSRDEIGNELGYYYGEDRYEYLEFPAGL